MTGRRPLHSRDVSPRLHNWIETWYRHEFSLKLHLIRLSLKFVRVLVIIQQWLGADQANRNYLSQLWSCLLIHIGVTCPQWVNWRKRLMSYKCTLSTQQLALTLWFVFYFYRKYRYVIVWKMTNQREGHCYVLTYKETKLTHWGPTKLAQLVADKFLIDLKTTFHISFIVYWRLLLGANLK